MLSEAQRTPSLPILPKVHLGSFQRQLPRTECHRHRHHPDRAWCRCLMTPRHPTTRVLTVAPHIGAALASDGDSRPFSRCCSSSRTGLAFVLAPEMDANTPKTSREGRRTHRIDDMAVL